MGHKNSIGGKKGFLNFSLKVDQIFFSRQIVYNRHIKLMQRSVTEKTIFSVLMVHENRQLALAGISKGS